MVDIEKDYPATGHGRWSGAAFAAQTATGSAEDGIYASFGPIGTVSGSIEVSGPGQKEPEIGPQEGCRGKQPLYFGASLSGTIALRVKGGFLRLNTSRAKGYVYRSYELMCKRGRPTTRTATSGNHSATSRGRFRASSIAKVRSSSRLSITVTAGSRWRHQPRPTASHWPTSRRSDRMAARRSRRGPLGRSFPCLAQVHRLRRRRSATLGDPRTTRPIQRQRAFHPSLPLTSGRPLCAAAGRVTGANRVTRLPRQRLRSRSASQCLPLRR